MNMHVPPKPSFEPFTGLPDLPAIGTLKALPQWVVWEYRLNKSGTKWTKPPLKAADGAHASHSDPTTWSNYDRAAEMAERRGFPGVGYVLTPSDDIGGFDLDDCRDAETGTLTPWAADIVALGETYAEVSPSGCGIRIFAGGKPEKAVKSDPAGVEIYAKERYLTVTGRHLFGTPTEILPAPQTLAALLARVDAINLQIQAEKEKIRAAAATQASGERAGIGGQFERYAAEAQNAGTKSDFFRNVNSAAFANLDAWVPELFGSAAVRNGKGYRVSSRNLRRDFEEDLSITSMGAKDFGVHDQGDTKGGARTAIDLAIEHGGAADAVPAALWLCERLKVDPATLGWRDRKNENEPIAKASGSKTKTERKAKRRDANDTRPVITLQAGALKEAVDAAEAALIARGGLYQRANQIVFVGEAPVKTHDKREVTAARIFERGEHALAEDISEAACVLKFDARAGEEVVVSPPSWVVKTLLDRTGRFRFPILMSIVNAPTLRHDGSLLDVPGYDAATGLYFDPRGVEFPRIDPGPTRQDAERALADLLELLQGFPFESEADRAVALSAILTACVRQALTTAPLHGFSAPTAGTGKSKLVDIASVVATGREAGVTAQTADEAEMEKRLGALLLEGATAIAIDNCEAPLGGAFLCVATTQSTATIRPLGASKTITVPTTALLTATGNNLVVAGDMTRRTIMCRLDAGLERPELRAFDFEPVQRAKEERVRYVVAALTILLAFKAAGSPRQATPLGSFEDWSLLVRDALLWLGCADPVATMESARTSDPRLSELSELLAQWRSVVGTDEITVRRVIDKATLQSAGTGMDSNTREFNYPDLREALLAVAGQGGAINGRRLGKWLAAHAKRVVDGCSIEQGTISSGLMTWKLVEKPQKPIASAARVVPEPAQYTEYDL